MKLSQRPQTTVSDTSVLVALCRVQQDFVTRWNKAELDPSIEQSHDLPGGAIYGFQRCGFVFYLPGKVDGAYETRVLLHCMRGWHHWHEGWSFCRNYVSVEQLRKVVVVGSFDRFKYWIEQLTSF